MGGGWFLYTLPTALREGAMRQFESKKEQKNQQSVTSSPSPSVPVTVIRAPVPAGSPNVASPAPPVSPPDPDRIIGYFENGLVLSGGRVVRVGEEFPVDGEHRRLVRVDVKAGKAVSVKLPGSSKKVDTSPAPPSSSAVLTKVTE